MNTAVKEKERSEGLPVPVVVTIVLLLLAAAAGYFLYRRAKERPAELPLLTQEATAYLPNLQLSDVDMQAAENYLKQTVATITGKITNNGPRTLQLVEIHCVFRDFSGQILLRQRTAIVGRKTGPVAAGQTSPFELNFDNVPADWNRALPDLVISRIRFEDGPGA